MQVLLTLLVQENSCRKVDTLLYEQIPFFQSQYYISSHLSASCTGKWMSVFKIAWFQELYQYSILRRFFGLQSRTPLGFDEGPFSYFQWNRNRPQCTFFPVIAQLENDSKITFFLFCLNNIDVIFGSSSSSETQGQIVGPNTKIKMGGKKFDEQKYERKIRAPGDKLFTH